MEKKQSQRIEAWRVYAHLDGVIRGALGEITFEQRLERSKSVNHMGNEWSR